MELFQYLDPYLQKAHYEEFTFGSHIKRFSELAFHLPDIRAGIIGIPFCNSEFNLGSHQAPDLIREELYQLTWHKNEYGIADFGNIKPGQNLSDTHHAISFVIHQMVSQNIIPVIIGGDVGNMLPVVNGFYNHLPEISITGICPDIAVTGDENKQTYFEKLILLNNPEIKDYHILGYQNYYITPQHLDFIHQLGFNAVRLGNLRSNIADAEPYMRDTDLISFQIGSVKTADAPGYVRVTPNGFQSDEICQLARFSGSGSKISAWALWDVNPVYDKNRLTLALSAQIIWHFLEALSNRVIEFPSADTSLFANYHVSSELHDYAIRFFRSLRTDRWWAEINFNNQTSTHYIPCTYDDYRLTCNNEIPEKFWKFFQKFIKK